MADRVYADLEDRVIDYFAERDRQSGNHHGVQCRSAPVQEKRRSNQREWDGSKADERGALFKQEKNQDYRNQDATPDQRLWQACHTRNLPEARPVPSSAMWRRFLELTGHPTVLRHSISSSKRGSSG